MATGLAYYYFDSKDAIVHAFYRRPQADLAPALEAAHREKTLTTRIEALIEAKFRVLRAESPVPRRADGTRGRSVEPVVAVRHRVAGDS